MNLPALLSALLLAGCTHATKIPVGPRGAAVPAARVEVLSQMPTRPHRQIGLVSVSGAQLALDGQIVRKLQKAAADLGADAVVITGEDEMSLGRGRAIRGEAIKYQPAN